MLTKTAKTLVLGGCLALAMLLTCTRPVEAAVIFSNLGIGDTYQTDVGFTLSVGAPIGADIDQGDAFTPVGNNFMLDRIELAAGLISGPNRLDVWLMSNAAGVPGAIIEAFQFSDAMGTLGDANPLLAANSALRPVLNAGTQYWLIASMTGPNAWAAWNESSTGSLIPHASRSDQGPWFVTSANGAFRVSGTAVPEPSSLLLLGAALAAFAVGRKRVPR